MHDLECLLAAAAAQGWSPTTDRTAIPRARPPDFLAAESEGRLLDRSRGDEVSSWSTEALIANFGTGWLMRTTSADNSALDQTIVPLSDSAPNPAPPR